MANPQPPRVKLELKPFTGSGTPLEARIFIRKVEAYGAVSGLNQEQLAQAASFAFTGAASRWYGTLEEAEDDRIDQWDTLRPVFEERFCRVHSSSELSRLARDLRQKTDESVDDFFDRCQELQFLEEASIPAAARAGLGAAGAAGFQAIHNNGVTIKFLNGLKRQIRDRATASDAATIQALLQAARRAESTLRDAERGSAAPVLNVEARGSNGGTAHHEGSDSASEQGDDNEDEGESGDSDDCVEVEFIGRRGYRRTRNAIIRRNPGSGGKRYSRGGARPSNTAPASGSGSRSETSRSATQTRSGNDGRNGGQCFGCGKYGHFYANCPDARNKMVSDVRAVVAELFDRYRNGQDSSVDTVTGSTENSAGIHQLGGGSRPTGSRSCRANDPGANSGFLGFSSQGFLENVFGDCNAIEGDGEEDGRNVSTTSNAVVPVHEVDQAPRISDLPNGGRSGNHGREPSQQSRQEEEQRRQEAPLTPPRSPHRQDFQ
jgi:type II secretory pathway pseudopilin PulG